MKKFFCIMLSLTFLFVGFPANAVGTSAAAAVVISGDTGELLYGQNADTRLPMASTTKIMTALLLCEYGDSDRGITVTKEMVSVEGSSMGLMPGDTVTLHDLLYGMMLASGNDAANTAAIVVGGTVERFVTLMNEKAAQLGLQNTHFVTPSGLDAAEHYTTAYELAQLARFALQNEEFAAAAASKSAVLYYGNPPYRRMLTNHNRLLKGYDGLVGVKTGFTKKSGRCLVTAAKREEKYVIAVTLGDPNDWEDHTALLDYGLSVIETVNCEPPQSSVSVPIIGGTAGNMEIALNPIAVSTAAASNITSRVSLPGFVYAPVVKGDKIGTVSYYSGETLLKTVDLRAQESVGIAEDVFLRVLWENFKYILAEI